MTPPCQVLASAGVWHRGGAASVGGNATERWGALQSRCPHRVPAMEACRSAMPCHGDRRVPPKRATTPAPALCPLPSPGRCRSCCPAARCVPAARGEGLNRPAAVGAAAQGRLAGGREASTGLPQPVMPESSLASWCVAAAVSGASRSVTPPRMLQRGSQRLAGSQPPVWLFQQQLSPQPPMVGKEPSQAPCWEPRSGTL